MEKMIPFIDIICEKCKQVRAIGYYRTRPVCNKCYYELKKENKE